MATLIEATNRLAKLLALPEGWDFGRGGPISASAYNKGKLLLQLLHHLGATDFDIVPGDSDGVVIAAYRGDRSCEIHCLSNGRFDFLHETEGDEDSCLEAISIARLVSELEGFGWRSLRFYASCTHNVIYRGSGASRRSLFGTPLEVEFRSLAPSASLSVRPSLATTSASSTTNAFADSRQSSGEYRSLPFQMAVA